MRSISLGIQLQWVACAGRDVRLGTNPLTFKEKWKLTLSSYCSPLIFFAALGSKETNSEIRKDLTKTNGWIQGTYLNTTGEKG